MKVVVIASKKQQKEFSDFTASEGHAVLWMSSIEAIDEHADADVYLDLLFEPEDARIATLHSLLPKPVVVNSVTTTLNDTDMGFVRINGWPGFLKNGIVEAAGLDPAARRAAESLFGFFGKQVQWVDDIPGFITPRVISLIINEAYLALDEGISTEEEIDTAMQLGTSYPLGPFTWARQIGLPQIVMLLEQLSKTLIRYTPSRLLLEQAEELKMKNEK